MFQPQDNNKSAGAFQTRGGKIFRNEIIDTGICTVRIFYRIVFRGQVFFQRSADDLLAFVRQTLVIIYGILPSSFLF